MQLQKLFTRSLIPALLSLCTGTSHAQNVGINTTSPTERLHVAGNIKADTVKPAALKLTPNAGTGKILTSDAAGNATWQATGNTGFGVWGDCATNGNISEYNPVAPDDGAVGDYFGFPVAIDGNNAAVGAYRHEVGANSDQGAVYFYRHNGSNWVLQQKVFDATGAAGDNFGISVSIDGNLAIIGTPGDALGSASIYQFNGTNWVFVQKITDATGAAGDNFGVSVSISGNYVIVGSDNDDVGANADQGSVCIFRYNVTTSNWVLMQKITDATGSETAEFGASVSIDGVYAIVGARWENVGANTDQGTASIYRYNGSNWVLMNKIIDATGTSNDQFGISVSVAGNYAVVGASGAGASGEANVFYYNGSSWVLMQKLIDASVSTNAAFGCSVSISGNYAIIGAANHDIGTVINQGASSIFVRVGNNWQKLQFILDPAGDANDSFGRFVAIDATTKRFVAGAYFTNPGGKVVFGKVN